MKNFTPTHLLKTLPLLFFLMIQTQAQAQVSATEVISIGRSVFGNKSKKKEKDNTEAPLNIDAFIKESEVNGRKISILRVPEEKITSAAKRYILTVQQRLESNYQRYLKNQHIEDYSYNIQNDIYDLKSFDATWPITYYEIELREYKAYDDRLTQTEKRIKDSTEIANRIEEQRLRDSARAAKKRNDDSLAYAKQIEDYHFVNKASLELKEKASAKSATIAKVNGGTYIKVWEIDEKTGYAQVGLEGLDGYVLYADLVEYPEELDFAGADIELYKRERYFSYSRNQAYFDKIYKAEEAKAAAIERQQSRSGGGGRTYHTGPRGGCYYINSNGNKQYVDRSLCR